MWDAKIGHKHINEAYLQTEQGLRPVRDFYSQTPAGMKRWKHAEKRPFDPKLRWIRRSPSYFGAEGDSISINDNGLVTRVFISGSNGLNYISVYDAETRTWNASMLTLPKEQFYARDIKYAGYGLFIAARLNNASRILISSDGVNWRTTYASGAANFLMCAATDGKLATGAMFYVHTPIFYTADIQKVTYWSVQKDIPYFYAMTCHKGLFVGATETQNTGFKIGDGLGGIYTSTNGKDWSRSMKGPYDHVDSSRGYDGFKSVNGKLFIRIEDYNRDGSAPWYRRIEIGLMADDASSYQVVISETSAEGETNRLQNIGGAYHIERLPIVYVRSVGRYLLFGRDALWYSEDGVHWDSEPQENFPTGKIQAVYVPGDGLYTGDTDDIYYAECP